jgi:hypothetical protein
LNGNTCRLAHRLPYRKRRDSDTLGTGSTSLVAAKENGTGGKIPNKGLSTNVSKMPINKTHDPTRDRNRTDHHLFYQQEKIYLPGL